MTKILEAERRKGGAAAKSAMSAVSNEIKAAWRNQIRGAGLGGRLEKTIRSQSYPKSGGSLGAAALVWTRAPMILSAFERGVTIRARNSTWLAIPLPAAGLGKGGAKMTPAEWQRRRGIKLHFVSRSGRTALLVAEGRVNKKGLGVQSRSKTGRGLASVPIFALVPQVTLRKRLNLMAEAQRLAGNLPRRIVAGWR